MLKPPVHIYICMRYKQKNMSWKALQEKQSINHWTILLQHLAFEKTSALALGSQYKSNGTITQSSSTKNIHKKVTSISSVRNSHHSAQKGRFKLSCLDILNSFCLMLLTLYLICTLKVNFERKATLASCSSMKICYKKCLEFPLSLFS